MISISSSFFLYLLLRCVPYSAHFRVLLSVASMNGKFVCLHLMRGTLCDRLAVNE